MGKLIFTYTDKDFIESNREANKVELDVPDDMDINEYKIVCVRMASGDLVFGQDDPNTIKELLHELNIKGGNKKIK